jgi:hypothetical protein
MPPHPLLLAPLDYNSVTETITDSKLELLPLHSPLLRQSSLISFPPLSNMLKFSGCSGLISDAEFEVSKFCYMHLGSGLFFPPIEITEETVTNSMRRSKDLHVHLSWEISRKRSFKEGFGTKSPQIPLHFSFRHQPH